MAVRTPWKPFDERRARRRRLCLAAAAILGVVLWGTLGLMWIEGWGFAKALYFTLITVTTVGYSDEGIGPHGRVFVILFLMSGIGVFSYALAHIVQGMVSEKLAWRRRMQSRIDALRGHVIVCGYGRMGTIVCRELLAAGREFVVVEQREPAWQAAVGNGYLALHGSGSDDDVLTSAGIAHATHLVSVVDSIDENIAIALSARDLNPDLHIQARAERASEERKLHRAGADRVVSPFHAGGLDVATAILRPKVAEFLARTSQAGGGVALGDVQIEPGSRLVGRSLADFGRNEAARLAFVSLERAGQDTLVPPPGSTVLRAGDHLVVAGDPAAVVALRGYGRGERSAA